MYVSACMHMYLSPMRSDMSTAGIKVSKRSNTIAAGMLNRKLRHEIKSSSFSCVQRATT